MTEQNATQESIADWAELDAQGEFFKPALNQRYEIRIASAKILRKAFKDGDTPKLVVEAQISEINGQPASQIWTTASYGIMKDIREHVRNKTLERTVFLLRKKEEDGKTKYVFDVIRTDVVGAQAPSAQAKERDIAEAGI